MGLSGAHLTLELMIEKKIWKVMSATKRQLEFPRVKDAARVVWPLLVLSLYGCTTTTTTSRISRQQQDPPRGFFQKLMDEMTERECNVAKFTCPYGLGPADEPCECTDPSGVVLKGRTVK